MRTQIKKHSYITVLLFFYTLAVHAQYNLVPNYSFEQYTVCPAGMTLELSRSYKPDLWYKPDRRDAVYYNACDSNNFSGVPINFFWGGVQLSIYKNGRCLYFYVLSQWNEQPKLYTGRVIR